VLSVVYRRKGGIMKKAYIIIGLLVVSFICSKTCYSGNLTQVCTDCQLLDIWGSSENDIYAGGYPNGGGFSGRLYHYDGVAWSPVQMSSHPITNIWGTSATNVYIAGFSGVMHYNGNVWQLVRTGFFFGIWGLGTNNVYAVGSSGKIDHYDGTTWSSMQSGVSNVLADVWGSSNNDVFAVGDSGVILHYDGIKWSPMSSGTSQYLYGVGGNSGNDVYAVGDFGTVLHYNNGMWSQINQALTTETLKGIWGSSPSDIYIVGIDGTVLHYDGIAWAKIDSSALFTSMSTNYISVLADSTPINFNSVWGTSSSNVYMVGDNGAIVHYQGVTATLITLSSFTATPKAGRVIIQWITEAETDNAGFNIYRAESENGEYTKLNASLIPAEGSSTQGASYDFTDNNVLNRKTYYYKLEDIDLSGTSTMHGPVSARPRLIYGVGK
jgi:hypothetical protein